MNVPRLSLVPGLAGLLLFLVATVAFGQTASRPAPTSPAPEFAPLQQAIERNDRSGLRGLLDGNPDLVRATNPLGLTPLHLAATAGHVRLMELLLERKADLNAQPPPLRNSPLDVAIAAGQRAAARWLVEKGARLTATDAEGFTALHRAASGGQRELVEFLLQNGADVHARSTGGVTPAGAAAWAAHPEVLALLLDRGADAQAKGRSGMSLLHFAAHAFSAADLQTSALTQLPAAARTPEAEKWFADIFRTVADIVPTPERRLATVKLLLVRGLDANAADESGERPLHLAARHDAAVATALLAHGASVDARDQAGFTALNTAAEWGRQDVVDVLLSAGASITIPSRDGRLPLFSAATRGHTAIIAALLKHKAAINGRETKHQRTPLHAAALYGHDAAVALLLEQGAEIGAVADDGWTPLHYAAATRLDPDQARWEQSAPNKEVFGRNHARIIELLVARGASVHVMDRIGVTPLHVAAMNGHTLGIERLVAARATIEVTTTNENLTPLHFAVRGNHVDAAETLLRHGANAKAAGVRRITPLHVAVEASDPRLVALLVQHGADVNATTTQPSTALALAAEKGNAPIVRALLEAGATVNWTGHERQTPLHFAARSGNADIVTWLLDRQAVLDARDSSGNQPIHNAVGSASTAALQVLIDRGAKIDAPGQMQATPLHLAVSARRAEAVALLLARGAPVTAFDVGRQTPLHVAALRGDPKIARLLLEHGAPLNAQSRTGETALHFAVMIRQPRDLAPANPTAPPPADRTALVALLVEAGADRGLRTQAGDTPFDVALNFGTKELARLVMVDAPLPPPSRGPIQPAVSPSPSPKASTKGTANAANATPAARLSGRGLAKQAKGDLDGAIADFTAAIAEEPNYGPAYANRAIALIAKGDFTGALDDYDRQLARSKSDAHYVSLYRFLVQRRIGHESAAADLRTAAAAWNPSWTRSLARFLTGDMSESALFAIVNRPTSNPPPYVACEAHFFAGMRALLQSQTGPAQRHLEQAVATDHTTRLAYRLARIELARLNTPP